MGGDTYGTQAESSVRDTKIWRLTSAIFDARVIFDPTCPSERLVLVATETCDIESSAEPP
jgi:hypothetical protein